MAGALAGLVGSVAIGVMMALLNAPTPDGGRMPMMGTMAMVVRSDSLFVGWLYHLFNSALIGAIFGWLLGNRVRGYRSGAGWGGVYGVAWSVLGGLVLMSALLGMSPFAPLMMAPTVPKVRTSRCGTRPEPGTMTHATTVCLWTSSPRHRAFYDVHWRIPQCRWPSGMRLGYRLCCGCFPDGSDTRWCLGAPRSN
ncbi:MAG TPA: hypothetical protein VGL99_06850 [Chloroflexota bacterium]